MGRGRHTSAGVTKFVELRRHTENEGDVLTHDGVRAALEIGTRLDGDYTVLVSSGMQRATQTLACFLAGFGSFVPGGVIVEPGLRTESEGRWREIYAQTGEPDLAAFRAADPAFVEAEEARLGAALARIFAALPEGGRALAVGHSPTNEAAVFALTGQEIQAMAKGEGVLVEGDGDEHRVRPID
jgi:broad specificity phosphatase PhoE